MRVKPARAQPRGQLLGGVAALAVILEPALPRAVRPQVKEVDIVAAYPAAELRAPDAVGVLRLVEVDLPVETRRNFSGVFTSKMSVPPGAMNRCSRSKVRCTSRGFVR